MENNSMALIINLIKKLILMIFEKYEVNKEFEGLGIHVEDLLNGMTSSEE